MSRAKRPYLPGAFFHLTARTQGKVDRFKADAMKTAVVAYLTEAADATDADVSAFVVMDNHVHIIARQGHAPISRLMQPFLRRCALMVQGSSGVKGHAFERRFRHRVFRTAEELRYCICYVHRNPVAAGICDHPANHIWSSAAAYASPWADPAPLPKWPRLMLVRELFALAANRAPAALCADYALYLETMLRLGRPPGLEPGAIPIHGDAIWSQLCTSIVPPIENGAPRRRDLRDVVNAGIKDICPELDIAAVRAFRGSQMSGIRARLAVRGAQAGYRGREIANYLGMSDARVSRILRAYREKSLSNREG